MSRALGRYELLRPLARGGMAEVFLARRRAAGVEKWLVVKRMRPERAGDARFLDLFVREARLSMSLTHQNIVPVFDFGRIDDQVFIAMERIEGKDLGSSLVKAVQHPLQMPPLLAAFVAAECCQALDYAHRRRGPDGAALGIVHRDVTPRNVLLSWSGEVKLTDFGIAALAGEMETKVIGTPAYMAPEQARGEPLDPRADVYGIGMVLREALTGTRPRPGDEREATLSAARKGELVPWPAGFDSPLVAIADRATSLDREARYADARAMLEDLDGFIVAERAANKSDAPARRLAAWLAEVWKEEREESAIEEAIEGEHLVSFLDDGALDVIGTGTVKSMAVTASEIGDAPAKPVVAGKPELPTTMPGTTQATGAGEPAEPAEPARKRPWLLPVAAIGAMGIGALAITTRGGSSPPAHEPTTELALASAAEGHGPEVHVVDRRGEPELHVVMGPEASAPTGSGSASSTKKVPIRTTGVGTHPRHDAAQGSATPAPAVLHKVLVNVKNGWAAFTVDGDPTRYETLATVKLATGPHVLHFTQGETKKDVAITVPDSDDLRVVPDLAGN